MTESKHTQGPWKIEETCKTAINAGTKHIAMVNYFRSGDENDVYGEEHKANANLIAAAPDLLDALERLLLPCERYLGPMLVGEEMTQARAAIAKAKGE